MVTYGRLFQKIGTVITGHVGAEGLNHIFDLMLYPATVWFLGPVWAGVVVIPLSIVWDLSVIKIYNYTTLDWFGFEVLHAKKFREVVWLAVVVRATLFIFFAWCDPPRAFILIRGRQLRGARFTPTDWGWFLTANLIGNIIWLLMLNEAFEFLRKIL